MKKNLLYFLMLVFSMGVFTACSDDDDVKFPIDKELAGVYKGTLDIVLNKGNVGKDLPKNITIVKASNNSINMELKDFKFGAMDLGTITITNCVLTQSGTTYTFVGSQSLTLPNPIGTCPVVVKGTIADGKTTINLDITVPALSQTVNVTYKGTKLSGSESGEAKIVSFTFDREVAAVDSLVIAEPVINESNKTITFIVADTAKAEHLQILVPTIVVSEKAVVIPGSNVAQDFNAPVVYTVIAENGTETKYTASISNTATMYGFENWSNEGAMSKDIFNPIGWATCNDAVALIKSFGSFAGITYEGEYPVRETEEHVGGAKAVLMESVDTKGGDLFGQKVPKVTSGTAFLGLFNAIAALEDPMATTAFGVMYGKKPVQVKGFYKYVAGAEFYDENGALVEGKKDKCAMNAVLYEVENEEEVLNGTTIYSSPKIVAKASFTSEGAAEFTPFELTLNYEKEYDATKKYKFTVIFASSEDGAAYKAAVGSKLVVDDVIIINE